MSKKVILAIGPVAILFAAAVFTALQWESIPQRVAIHFNWKGEADSWVERGPAVFLPALLGLLTAVPMAIIGAVGSSGKSKGAANSLTAAAWFAAALTGYLTVRPALVLATPAPDVPWMVGVVLVAAAALCVYTFRQSSRQDSPPPDSWKWGVIYYNPADSALLVPKRFGMGWTLNFANRWSWVIFVPVLLLPVILTILR